MVNVCVHVCFLLLYQRCSPNLQPQVLLPLKSFHINRKLRSQPLFHMPVSQWLLSHLSTQHALSNKITNFFFFFFGFNTIFLGKGIDNPRQISHMHQTLHLLLPSTYSWNWLFINKKNSASKCFVEPNWKLVNVPVKLNVACETSLVWFVVGNQKSTGAVFSSTFNLRVNSRNIE